MHDHQMQYDTTITQFSPDGRVLQVEYAREAVRRGALSAAIKCNSGILVIADRRYHSPLAEKSSKEKIHRISPACCCVSSGLVADSRVLVNYARRISSHHTVTYGESMDIHTLVVRISNVKRSMTQYGGARPFGVSMLFCGWDDDGGHIFETDPSGAFKEYNATAIGKNSREAVDILDGLPEDFTGKFGLGDSFDFLLKAFSEVAKGFQPENLDICIVSESGVRQCSHSEFTELLELER